MIGNSPMINANNSQILNYIKDNPSLSSSKIHSGVALDIGYATTKRALANLVNGGLIIQEERGITYRISPVYQLVSPIDLEVYFKQEIDERKIQSQFNLDLIPNIMSKAQLFTVSELTYLDELQNQYHKNISQLEDEIFIKEMERLAIDLSWKSSQIEGDLPNSTSVNPFIFCPVFLLSCAYYALWCGGSKIAVLTELRFLKSPDINAEEENTLVKKLEERIRVNNQLGKGTTFSFTLSPVRNKENKQTNGSKTERSQTQIPHSYNFV